MAIALCALGVSAPVSAQKASDGVFAPNFWDPQRRLERPDLTGLRAIRFITDDEYPPFAFPGPDGALAGFNVDLARAVCEELKVPCTIQARRFDTILGAIESGAADAAIASIAPRPRRAGRSISPRPITGRRAASSRRRISRLPTSGRKRSAANARGSWRARRTPPSCRPISRASNGASSTTLPALLAALRAGDVKLAFGDGVTLAIWLNGAEGYDCCAFRGGPYLDPPILRRRRRGRGPQGQRRAAPRARLRVQPRGAAGRRMRSST